MSIKSCDDCKSRWQCNSYKNWCCLGHKEPDAYLCPKFVHNNEEEE